MAHGTPKQELKEVARVLDQAHVSYPSANATQAERVVSVIQRRDELVKALLPFAKLARGMFDEWEKSGAGVPPDVKQTTIGDGDHIITVGDLRRALAAFDKAQGAR